MAFIPLSILFILLNKPGHWFKVIGRLSVCVANSLFLSHVGVMGRIWLCVYLMSESVLWFLAGLLRGRMLFQSPVIISQQYPNKCNWSRCPRPMLAKRCICMPVATFSADYSHCLILMDIHSTHGMCYIARRSQFDQCNALM